MRWIFLVLPLAACSPKPDACQLDLIIGSPLEDTELTTKAIEAHNTKLRELCPEIQPRFKELALD